jgi:hypothetical protein
VVTVNGYTRDEDMSEAILVVSELGDPDGAPIEVLANRGGAQPGDFVTLDDLRACLSASVEPPHRPAPASPPARKPASS